MSGCHAIGTFKDYLMAQRIDANDCRHKGYGLTAIATESAQRIGKDGYVILDDISPKSAITCLADYFWHKYTYIQSDNLKPGNDVMEVGKLRWLLNIRIQGAFLDEKVYANELVDLIAKNVLGDSFVIDSFGLVLSMPGSTQQRFHSDSPTLFNSEIDGMIPAHALTVAIPLISMNAHHGTTALFPQSHRQSSGHSSKDSPIIPDVPIGSCII